MDESGAILLVRVVIGIAIPLCVGPSIQGVLDKRRKLMDTPDSLPGEVEGSVLGYTERIFFTILVSFDVSGYASAMMTWIAAKMVAGWNRNGLKLSGAKPKPAEIPAEPPTTPPANPPITPVTTPPVDTNEGQKLYAYAITALYGNMLSMLAALIDGLIIRGKATCAVLYFFHKILC